jgi:hypothetical protein
LLSKIKKIMKNCGTGAGGRMTNVNGLSYEKMTDLNEKYNIIKEEKYCKKITFKNDNKKIFSYTKQGLFLKYMFSGEMM